MREAVRRLDNITKKRMTQAIRELADSDNPESLGKRLKADMSGERSWRIGKYQLIYGVDREAKIIYGYDLDDREGVY